MKIDTQILDALTNNEIQFEKVDGKLAILQEIYNLDVSRENLNQQRAQLVKQILDKEGKTLDDIVNLDLKKGEITFKEVKDAEPERPDDQTIPE